MGGNAAIAGPGSADISGLTLKRERLLREMRARASTHGVPGLS